MKILEKITKDHARIADLFARIQAPGNGCAKMKSELCRRLVLELRAHAQFEEQAFYPVLAAVSEEAEDLVQLAVGEHLEFDRMLRRVEKWDGSGGGLMPYLGHLQRWVEEHVEDEENDIFPFARDLSTVENDKDLARLDHALMRRYSRSAAE